MKSRYAQSAPMGVSAAPSGILEVILAAKSPGSLIRYSWLSANNSKHWSKRSAGDDQVI